MFVAPMHTTSVADLEERALATLSTTPRPFLRWAGSKRRFLFDLVRYLPRKFATYYEPFLGGGSLFFLLRPRQALLGDRCLPLLETYRAVRDNPKAVLRFLAPLKPSRTQFYAVRSNPSTARFKGAAEFIYLNKTCWNGLYRVNQSGEFNVPFGRPKSDGIADAANIRECSSALAEPGVEIRHGDFDENLSQVVAGDLVFLDPPYVTGHSNNGFRDYNEILFSWLDQERLAGTAERLRAAGATVLVTNADHPSIRALYPNFEKHVVASHSTISGRMDRRGKTSELLLVGCRKREAY